MDLDSSASSCSCILYRRIIGGVAGIIYSNETGCMLRFSIQPGLDRRSKWCVNQNVWQDARDRCGGDSDETLQDVWPRSIFGQIHSRTSYFQNSCSYGYEGSTILQFSTVVHSMVRWNLKRLWAKRHNVRHHFDCANPIGICPASLRVYSSRCVYVASSWNLVLVTFKLVVSQSWLKSITN